MSHIYLVLNLDDLCQDFSRILRENFLQKGFPAGTLSENSYSTAEGDKLGETPN